MDHSDSVFDLLDNIERRHDQWQRAAGSGFPPSEHVPYGNQVVQPMDDVPYDEVPAEYGYTEQFDQEAPVYYDPEPPQFDSFDYAMLRQPTESSIGHVVQGRGRLPLPPHQTQYSHGQTPYLTENSYHPRDIVYENQGQYSIERVQRTPDSQWQESRFFSSPRDSSGPAGQSSPVFRANQQQRNRQKLVERDRKKQEAIVHRSNPTEARDRVPRYKSAQTVQGIILVSTHELPDRLRNVFPFPVFNAVQSRCYDSIFNTDDNFVLSSPTGSGKTAVFELAICRAIKQFKNEEFKVVYQAPTKALCSERKEDWTNKFRHLDCKCEELTGDSDHWQMKNVQEATIIVTTPEKWDSITRKWKDHMKLMKMIKLFLIDEVHILREDRGATLEAIVSRTKSVDSSVRFIAVSATVPNVEDIAEWLGRSSNRSREPALLEKFGEEFRPVKLQKHVIGYDMKSSNEFAFSKFLDKKLLEVISRYSQRKPIMVFCFTRRSCEETAKALASWWAGSGLNNRHWDGPKEVVKSKLQGLRDCLTSGVAYHHAGLDLDDRRAVAKGYMNGNINVICCTSTLAVGINLPCHFVVLKGTASYSNNVIRDYSDIEVMQMLGRAGRPQFDDSAVAVIMCRPGQVGRYQKMVSGQEILESCLHRNLIEHLNAEVGLGTITDIASAKRWLTGTFLYVRLKKNPTYYKLKDGARINNLDELLDEILSKDIQQLQELGLVETEPRYKATEYGDAMARYYVLFDTMKSILQLPTKAKVSDILSAIAQASEFREIRFRSGEKQFYKAVNKLPLIRFPIPVNLDMPAHKVSLIIQSILGAIDTQSLPDNKLHAHQFTVDKAIIFQNVRRMIRCVVDCKLHIDDSISARNALAFSRSLAAEVWDDSPNILKQLDGVGNVAVRKLVNGGIKDFETLDQTPAHRIEMIMSRNPPYGQRMLDKAKLFPKLRVCLQMNGAPSIKRGEGASINVRAEIGFMNDIVPATFNRQSVFICFLAETSDGQKIHFCRISAKHLDAGKDVLFCANLTSTTQMIFAHVMCDEQAGTLRTASLKPTLPAHAFHLVEKKSDQRDIRGMMQSQEAEKKSNNLFPNEVPAEELDDADFDWDDFDAAAAAVNDFQDIDDLIAEGPEKRSQQQKVSFFAAPDTSEPKEPKKLPSGKWECNHPCKDKAKCRHLCCKEGVDKPPKQRKTKRHPVDQAASTAEATGSQTKSTGSTKESKLSRKDTIAPKAGSGQKKLSFLNLPMIDLTGAREVSQQHHSNKTNRGGTSIAVSPSVADRMVAPGHVDIRPFIQANMKPAHPTSPKKSDSLDDEYGDFDFDFDDLTEITPLTSTKEDDWANMKEVWKTEGPQIMDGQIDSSDQAIHDLFPRADEFRMQAADDNGYEGDQQKEDLKFDVMHRGNEVSMWSTSDQEEPYATDVKPRKHGFHVGHGGRDGFEANQSEPGSKRRKTMSNRWVTSAVDENALGETGAHDQSAETEEPQPATGGVVDEVVDEEYEELKRWAVEELGDHYQFV